MTKSSGYTRDLTKSEIKDLQTKYQKHMKRTRGGFLSKEVKERLLHITNWEEETTSHELHQYFYEIREHVKTAIGDFQLLCDVLTETELQSIFGTKESTLRGEDMYPITNVLSSLLPTVLPEDILKESINTTRQTIESAKIDLTHTTDKDRIKDLKKWLEVNIPRSKQTISNLENQIEKLPEQEWRKFILEDLIIQGLTWYLKSGIFKTDSHRRLLDDAKDAITVMSSGKKKFSKYDESFYDSTRTL